MYSALINYASLIPTLPLPLTLPRTPATAQPVQLISRSLNLPLKVSRQGAVGMDKSSQLELVPPFNKATLL